MNKYLANNFFKLIPVWKLDFDEELNTVHPRKIVMYSKILLERYPEKKFIIHLMQPHYPFLNKNIEGTTGIKKLTDRMLNKRSGPGITVFHKLQKGLITLNEVKDSYNENLFIVMKYVVDIVNLLDGKIFITSDHGEALGENYHKYLPIKVYGHPRGTRINALTDVPWYEIKK